jgi:hypothetical protein
MALENALEELKSADERSKIGRPFFTRERREETAEKRQKHDNAGIPAEYSHLLLSTKKAAIVTGISGRPRPQIESKRVS